MRNLPGAGTDKINKNSIFKKLWTGTLLYWNMMKLIALLH